jgi:hypothetical protein
MRRLVGVAGVIRRDARSSLRSTSRSLPMADSIPVIEHERLRYSTRRGWRRLHPSECRRPRRWRPHVQYLPRRGDRPRPGGSGIYSLTATTEATAVTGYSTGATPGGLIPVTFPVLYTQCDGNDLVLDGNWPVGPLNPTVVPMCSNGPGNVGWIDWTPPPAPASWLTPSPVPQPTHLDAEAVLRHPNRPISAGLFRRRWSRGSQDILLPILRERD